MATAQSLASARIIDSIIAAGMTNVLHVSSSATQSEYARIRLMNVKKSVMTLDTLVHPLNAEMHVLAVNKAPSAVKNSDYVVFQIDVLNYAPAKHDHKVIGFKETYGESTETFFLAARAWDKADVDYGFMTYSKKDGFKLASNQPENAAFLMNIVKGLWNKANDNRAFPGDQRAMVHRAVENGYKAVSSKDEADSSWSLAPYGRYQIANGRGLNNKTLKALYAFQSAAPATPVETAK